MKGVIFEAVGAQPKVVDTLVKPKPGPGQVLVRSLYTAMNPVDSFMAYSGILVTDWPLVLGVDASGVIVESTPEAESEYNLREGDHVCGCTRLGYTQYGSGQEYFLMDAEVTIPKPKNVDLIQAATIGVGIETAALGLFQGLKCALPIIDGNISPRDEWIVVLGGSSSVGGFAVQLARASGYKVVASCSAKSAESVQNLGAEIFDYNSSVEEQAEAVKTISGGADVRLVFDAVANDDPQLAKELFRRSSSKEKCFATTNDWSEIPDFEGGKTYAVALGGIGRPEATELNGILKEYIPLFVRLIECGRIRSTDYSVFGNGGFEDLLGAHGHKAGGSAELKKVVVKIQDE